MQAYRYVKQVPVVITIPVIPFLTLFLGSFLLFWGLGPIVTFKLFYTPQGAPVVPVSDEVVARAIAAETVQPNKTAIANWLPAGGSAQIASQVDTYRLSIPKLHIKDAIVKIGSDDLSKQLVHWADSALPGKKGVAVVFGHSILPQFYNPTNYFSIFSLLPTLKNGDEIFVKYDGVEYRYEVSSQKVVKPEDVSGLDQHFDDAYMTLVTCVPPGTYFERLWLTARLTSYEKTKK